MDWIRTSNFSKILGVALVGLFALASLALAQTAMHRNGFETKTAWNKGAADGGYEEIAHRIDDRDPHNGRGSEYIEFDAKKGKFINYYYGVGKAPINEETRVAVWLRSNRAGMKLMARIVLPNERDPNNLDYRLTTYIEGDTYQQAGRWQLVELSRPVKLAKQQQQLMIEGYKRQIDFTGAYIDALVLNLYAGPGPTRVWIDDLEVGPIESAPAAKPDRVDNDNTIKPANTRRRNSAVEFVGNRLMVGNRRMFVRAIRYTDTMLPVLSKAGFNTVCFGRNVSAAQVGEAGDLGMWVVPEFRVTDDKGGPLTPDDITKQVQRFADHDALLFHRIGGVLSFENATLVARAAQVARGADAGHPIAGDVWDGLLPYSRSVNLLNVHRFPLMTTLELPDYRKWIQARQKLANPGTFTWTWIQTHLPAWYSEILYNQDALAEFKEPVGPQPEQIRLLAYTALASGCRGLGYWSDRFLADSHQGRDRLLCCALLNQEMDMLESLLVTAEDSPQWIDTSVRDVKAAVLRCDKGVLVIPIWQGKFSQFVPGQAAVSKLVVTVPQIPKTTQAWEVTPGEVRGLRVERVDQGMRVTLPEFGLTSAIVFTADNNLIGRFQDQARSRRQQASQWSYDMAYYEYEKVVKVQAQLEKMGIDVPDSINLLRDGKRRLLRSQELWKTRKFSEAYHEANRALRPIRILMRAQWEKAVRGLDTPVASPYAVSFYTLPRHWQYMDLVRRSSVGPNQLLGGNFEVAPERKQDSWKESSEKLDDVIVTAARVSELPVRRSQTVDPKSKTNEPKIKAPTAEYPVEGRQCAMLQIRAPFGKQAPTALERTHVSLVSGPVRLPPGTLVRISGMVNIPATITASPDGALMFDSAGGEPLAIRMTEPTPWKKYEVYRKVPASGTINVTLQLTGVGTVYFDDIRIEPLVPPNAAPFPNAVGQR